MSEWHEIIRFLMTVDSNEATVASVSGATDQPESEVLEGFKTIAAKIDGLSLKIGRRGYKTRLVGSLPIKELVSRSDAVKNIFPFAGIRPATFGAETDDTVAVHTLTLRTDPIYKIEIPVDLTSKEAERISAFVKALVLDSD